MTLRERLAKPAAWWWAAGIAALILLVAATDANLYVLTSPPDWDLHVLARKAYSIVAFAVVGYLVARARRAGGRTASPAAIAWIIAAYSAVIEVVQFFVDQPYEGLVFNAIDVACGFIGGWIAAVLASRGGHSVRER